MYLWPFARFYFLIHIRSVYRCRFPSFFFSSFLQFHFIYLSIRLFFFFCTIFATNKIMFFSKYIAPINCNCVLSCRNPGEHHLRYFINCIFVQEQQNVKANAPQLLQIFIKWFLLHRKRPFVIAMLSTNSGLMPSLFLFHDKKYNTKEKVTE